MDGEKKRLNKSVTSNDVAKIAGVSQSTVSRVFSGTSKYPVKEELKNRVLKAAREVGYCPNMVARGMTNGKTNMVGLVIGDNLGPFYNAIVNVLVGKLQKMGKQCLVFKASRTERLDKVIEGVLKFHVEVAIVTASAMTKVMTEEIERNDIPVILLNRFIPGLEVSTVYVDPLEGSRKVAEYLCSKGHKNIGYIHLKYEADEETEKRIGFYSALRQHQIYQIKEETSGYDYREGYEAGLRMLSTPNRPTAIFCTSDLIAMGVIDAARNRLGLRIPEDLAIVGYDDIEMASWDNYNLTTVHQPADRLTDKIVEIIQYYLETEGEKETIVEMIEPELVERGSV